MFWRPTAVVCCVFMLTTGCSQNPGQPVAKAPPSRLTQGSQPPASIQPTPIKTVAPPANITEGGEFARSGRSRPVASAGGGGEPAPQPTQPAVGATSGSAAAPGSTQLGLPNGLYPVMNSGGSSNLIGSLKNGLYPQIASQPPVSSSPGTAGRNRPVASVGGGGELGAPPVSAPSTTTSVGGSNTSPRGSRPGFPANPNAAGSQQALIQADGESQIVPSPLSSDEEFLAKAKNLFSKGEENEAVRHLYAYLLAKEDAFGEYPLQWIPGLAEPRAFLRMGIGVEYQTLKDFDGKPPVIGDPVAESGGRRNQVGDGNDTLDGSAPNAGGSSNSPYANAITETPAGFLLYYTGDYIERLYRELNERRKRDPGFFGKLLVAIPDRVPTAGDTVAAAPPINSSPGTAGRSRPSASAGTGVPGGGNTGSNPGNQNAGSDSTIINPAGRNTNRKLIDVWVGSAAANPPERLVIGTLMPGIMCLGEGKTAELVKRAKSYGLDAVFVLDVNVGKARGANYSSTSLKLYLVNEPEKHVVLNRSLKNTTVMETRRGSAGGGDSDPLVIELNRVLKDYVDENLKCTALPESLTAENVASRVERVVNGTYHDPLQVAVEVVGFYRMGMLQEDKAIAALNKLLGEGGDVILSGSDSEKADFLKSQLSKSLSDL